MHLIDTFKQAIKCYFFYYEIVAFAIIFATSFFWVGVQAPRGMSKTAKIKVDLHTPLESQNRQNIKTMADDLTKLADIIARNIIFTQKEVLTSDEAARYLGISKSSLYKMTMSRAIPHYKSMGGRLCYFNRREIENWMQTIRVATDDELEQQAQRIVRKGGKR